MASLTTRVGKYIIDSVVIADEKPLVLITNSEHDETFARFDTMIEAMKWAWAAELWQGWDTKPLFGKTTVLI